MLIKNIVSKQSDDKSGKTLATIESDYIIAVILTSHECIIACLSNHLGAH